MNLKIKIDKQNRNRITSTENVLMVARSEGGLGDRQKVTRVKKCKLGQLQPESWLLTFLPEQHELQHMLQLLHKLPGPGLCAVAQLPGPAGQQCGQHLCRHPGLRLPDLGVLLPQCAGQLRIQEPGCRGGLGSGGHRGHPEREGDYEMPE